MTGGLVRKISLRQDLFAYLESASFLSGELKAILHRSHLQLPSSAALEIDATTAEMLRGILTERLAAVGFDESYKPTFEGLMLEDLIDCFY